MYVRQHHEVSHILYFNTIHTTVDIGTYDVLLHFAEVWRNGQFVGARRFNVFIEKKLVLEEYDMYELYGGYTAIIESFSTTVTDGNLTIDFVRGSIQNPKVRQERERDCCMERFRIALTHVCFFFLS